MKTHWATAIVAVISLFNQIPAECVAKCEDGTSFAHPSNCEVYLVCVYDQLIERPCPATLWFNSELGVCDYPENVNCLVEGNFPTTSETITTELTTTTPEPEICEHGASFAHPLNCGSYLVCVYDQLIERPCPASLWFNVQLGVCDYPENVNCLVEGNSTTYETITPEAATTPEPTTTVKPTTTTPKPTTTTSKPTTTTPKPTTTTIRTTTTPKPTTTTPKPTTTTSKPTTTTKKPTTVCRSQPALGTLYRLYRRSSNNHFYTHSLNEANNAANNLGYVRELSPGLVATSARDCLCGNSLKPVYRVYREWTKNLNDDHFYTNSLPEANNAVANLGYKHEGIAFYCANRASYCGANVPLHRYHRQVEHFYTSNASEGSGRYEGIVCYIW